MKRGREKFQKYKAYIGAVAAFYKLFPLSVRKKLLVRHRMTRGTYGLVLRYALLCGIAKSVGDNVSVHEGVYLYNPQNITFGNNVSIQPMCYIECGKIGITVGNDAAVAHGVTMVATKHGYHDLTTPIKDQPLTNGTIVIGDNVWIGAKATILYNTVIANGTVVAAGAVVTKDTGENTVVFGVPAVTMSRGGNEHATVICPRTKILPSRRRVLQRQRLVG